MIKYLSKDVWKTIKQLSKKAKHIKIAVAYFGTEASNMIDFRDGDTLIVALSEQTVSCGQVNPFEIEKLLDKGVIVYTVSNIHSKVFLFDDKVIIGSTNISYNSENNLIESALLTDDVKTINDVNAFFKEYSIEKVERDFIEICKDSYQRPKGELNGKRNKRSAFAGELSPVWIFSTEMCEITESDEEALAKDQEEFENEIDTHVFNVDEFKFKDNDKLLKRVKKGDIVIELYTRKSVVDVIYPKRVLGFTRNYKEKAIFIRVEETKIIEKLSWTKFNGLLRKQGITFITNNSNREIKSNSSKKKVLNCFTS